MIDRRSIFLGAGATGLVVAPFLARQTPGAPALNRGARVIGEDLNELRSAPASDGAVLYKGSIYRWVPGDHSRPPLGPADDVNVVRHAQTPITAGAWVRQPEKLSVRAFGAVTGASASPAANTAAFLRAIAAADAAGLPLHLDGGDYLLDADGAASGGLNFARAGLHIKGEGAILRFRGRGKAFVIDEASHDGAFLEGMTIEDIVIVGEPGVTDGFYSRGVVRSSFRNIEVRDVGGKAFHIRHGVSSHYDGLKYSPPLKPPVSAMHGLYIDNNGASFYSANCVFTNAVMEDFPGIGCQLADATGILFCGGTFEGCATGLVISPASGNNVFLQTWTEANQLSDAVISGNGNGFVGGRFMSTSEHPNVRISNDAHGTWFAGGGYIRAVDIADKSTSTSFHQVGVDENRPGTIGFTGRGSFTRIGCTKVGPANNVVGVYDDVLGAVQAIGGHGTWSPVLTPARGAISQNQKLTQGSYHRIGNLVFAQCFIYVDNVRSPAGEISVLGLPFVPAFRQPGSIHATQLRPSTSGALQVRAEPGTRMLSLSKLLEGKASAMAADIAADTTLALSITYTARD